MGNQVVQLLALGGLLFSVQGCAAVGLVLLATGIGVGAGTGVEYTMNGTAYRTFTTSLDELHGATVTTLHRMAITVDADDRTNDGRTITAQAADRTVEVELERLTEKTTRMRVVVKQGIFFRDRATAGEILTQTGQTLDEGPAISQRSK